MSIYNFDYHTKGNKVQCYNTLSLTFDEYVQYNKTHNLKVEIGLDQTQVFQIQVDSSNGYKSLFFTIGILFIIFFIMSLYLSIVINILANQLPSDFIAISKFKKINACLCKIFPFVFILLSWIIFLIIIITWGFIVTKHCDVARNADATKVWSLSKYYNDAVILNSINTGVWFIFQYIGALIRQLVYVEPFMYNPIVGKGNKVKAWFLHYIGP